VFGGDAPLRRRRIHARRQSVRIAPCDAEPRQTRSYLTGELSTRIPNNKTGYGYQLSAHAMGMVVLGPHGGTDNASFGMLCGHEQTRLRRNAAELRQTVYLSLASCRPARSHERARLSLLSVRADDNQSRCVRPGSAAAE
jgi:hypothetical protein